ncbi:alpha/beta fold hydrolase [Pusillimonas noertemannii]|uniref:alpha/beta fold hydrolase n=2 Tax=Pusillimonas noertemannii TaxID=305977 RepID=UPI000301ACED|nr:alpha/beta fold hydrolase [Pusillimonas noertemannii]
MIQYPCAAYGIQTRVLEAGAGPALVFIHGLGARADRWRHNLEPLAAAGYRCIAIDLPGHGFAGKANIAPFSVPRCADWLAAILQQIGAEHYALVGTSLGGYIAATIACRSPQQVGALVLVGTLGIVPMGEEARAAISSRFGTVSREGIERKLRTVLFDPGLVTPAWIEEEWRINNSPGAHEAFACIADYIRDGIDDDVIGGQLAAMDDRRHSTAVIWGLEDKAVPVNVGHRCREILQPALYNEIPETGHGPYLEQPQVFNELLKGFLACEGVYPPASGVRDRQTAPSA